MQKWQYHKKLGNAQYQNKKYLNAIIEFSKGLSIYIF